jgi:hypothetical protein
MDEIDTREIVRGLVDIVRALAVQNQQLAQSGIALVAALEKFHPGIGEAYKGEMHMATLVAMPLTDQLIGNIDALRRQWTA